MFSKEERSKIYASRELVQHLFDQRGKKYFPHLSKGKDRYKECAQAVTNPSKGVIVLDNRPQSESTHLCLFINGAGQNIALPLAIDSEKRIAIITIKNIAESQQNPKWFYDQYERIAKTRDMPAMTRTWSPDYEKD